MTNLAIIPARGGSKRIPRKNIKDFFGKPVIAYPIRAALDSGLFEEVMVSTDDPEIAEVSKSFGAIVPVLRSSQNADDHAGLADVVKEVLDFYQKTNRLFERFCCILPATPFVLPEQFKKSLNFLISGKYASVFPAIRFSHPIQRAFKIENGNALMLRPETMQSRTQDLQNTYFDSGQFYWMKVSSFYKENRFFTQNTGAIEFPEADFIDIDNETDWWKAEQIFRIKNQI